MSTLGGIQKQLSQLMSITKAHGYQFEDVLPAGIQDQLLETKELKVARAYIKELEVREKKMKAENTGLASSLEAKQAEIDNLPAEFKALKVDIQQAQRSIDYYKELAENANDRASRYQRKLAESTKNQMVANEESGKMQRLERELADREAAMFKLLEENRAMAEIHETQHAQDLKSINEKEAKFIALINHSNQLEVERMEAVENSETISDTYDTLVKSLEAESVDTAKLVDRHYRSIRSSEQLYAALSTELAPINSFYHNTFSILSVYQCIFQSLCDSKCDNLPAIPQDLEAMLDAACDDLEGFQALSAAMSAEGLAQIKVRKQVDDMAKSAGQIYTTLDCLKRNVVSFVNRLRNSPDACLVVKGQFRGLRTPVSPASSISSFTSMKKRIWL